MKAEAIRQQKLTDTISAKSGRVIDELEVFLEYEISEDEPDRLVKIFEFLLNGITY